jgi:hypothetical protein
MSATDCAGKRPPTAPKVRVPPRSLNTYPFLSLPPPIALFRHRKTGGADRGLRLRGIGYVRGGSARAVPGIGFASRADDADGADGRSRS